MREKPPVLENVAQAALLGPNVDAFFRIEIGLAVHDDSPCIRPDKPCDHIYYRGLPCSGSSE
jgi:hypothetical protein